MSNISFSSGYGEYISGEFFTSPAFELRSNNNLIFSREFSSESSDIVNLEEDYFFFIDHNFVTGEELKYTSTLFSSNSPLGIATTSISGVSTDILPETLYAVKIDSSKIKVSASKTEALLEEPSVLDLTSYGTGTHRISSKNPNHNTLITLNNIIQTPIVSTALTSHTIEPISFNDLSVKVNDLSIFKSTDIIKIHDELFKITSVGIGSTNIIEFDREVLGSTRSSHPANSTIVIIEGNYNIIDSFIYFTESPYGNSYENLNGYTFSGRVLLRSGIKNTDLGPYDKNYIIDSISTEFDGQTSSFTLKNNFNDITGISTNNAIFTLNDVFQPPSRLTGNLIEGAYVLSENSGITTITMTGNIPFPPYDVNISELPRGGIIYSVGSTQGLGYQPLISAGATAIVSVAGTIQSVSIGYSGSGYRSGIQTVNVGVALSDVIDTNVEIIGVANVSNGQILSVNITNPGSGYTSTNPPIVIFDPPIAYNNIPLIYSSESNGSGVGTEAKINIVVGQGSSVIDFTLTNLGYGYEFGEILTVSIDSAIGIPTTSPFKEFKIIVDSVYYDKSSIRTFGELVIFDPIDNLFNGQRRIFPLKLNGKQTAISSKVGSNIDVQNSIFVFIDTVLQVPGEGYIFDGGSVIEFTTAPRGGSTSTILFYAGTENVDTSFVEVFPTIEPGDTVQIFDSKDQINTQNPRRVYDIISVDVIETNLYGKQGISVINEERPIKWCPQNEDKFISGTASTVVSISTKDRLIYEPAIQPFSYVISGIGTTDTEIFVDNLKTFFDNKNESTIQNDVLIVSQENKRPASGIVTMSTNGTISDITITDSGYGYLIPPQVSISAPISIGTTAKATANINSFGQVTSVDINNYGSNYDPNSPALVIFENPTQKTKIINDVLFEGDFGIISGVGTTSIGISTCIVLDLFIPLDSYLRNEFINSDYIPNVVSGISTDYYIYIENSNIGNSITSLDKNQNTIGIGTTFIDNIYQVKQFSVKQKTVLGIGLTNVNEIVVEVKDNSSLIGVAGSGYYGDYSWGRIYNINNIGTNFNSYYPGITTSTIVKRYNPLKYSNYLT